MKPTPVRSLIAHAVRVAGAALALFAIVACQSNLAPTPGFEERCTDACHTQAYQCGIDQCVRGCRFVLDRLVEHEGPRIAACVAKAKTCDDTVFAECAARSGPYLDGGPPPPGPKKEVDLDDDEGS